MKNNYPIKYAVIPMIEQIGWTPGMHDLEKEYGTVCYIVSKCFVVNETKEYKQNGKAVTSYNSVCPFEYRDFDIWKRCEPSFNLIHGHCTNEIITSEIYDTYDEAVVEKNQKNSKLKTNRWVFLPYDEKFKEKVDKLNAEFDETLSFYNQLERMIEKKTSDLKTNNEIREQSVFKYQNGELKNIQESIYSIMGLYDNYDFRVYNVSESEFEGLKNGVFDLSKNSLPLIIYDSKAKVMRLMNPGMPDRFINNGAIQDYYYGTLRRPGSKCPVFYTLETYQDIVDSYQITNINANTIKLVRKK